MSSCDNACNCYCNFACITGMREKELSEQQVAGATEEFLDDILASLPFRDDEGT